MKANTARHDEDLETQQVVTHADANLKSKTSTTTTTSDGLAVVAALGNTDAEVRVALETEHSLTFRQAVALYPSAVFWSLFFSMGVIM